MIDFYDIVLRIKLSPADRARIPRYDLTRPFEKLHKFDVKGPSCWTAGQHATIQGSSVRLKVCPAKVMGRWNAFGTNDLRKAVLETAPRVLRQLGLTVTPALRKALIAGRYEVKEVHVTEHFYLHNRSISEFLRAMFRRLGETHFPEMMRRGVGFYLEPRSRSVSYSFYDKANHFNSELRKLQKHKRKTVYDRRMDGLRDDQSLSCVALGMNMAIQRMVAGSGPRLEMKFGDQFFARSDLKRGSAWEPETAANLYQHQLQELKLPGEVSATYARERAKDVLTPTVFQTFVLWALGDDVRDQKMSGRTLSRHRRAILDKMGYDILKAASATFGTEWKVNAAAVFNWENRIDVDTLDVDGLWHLGAPAFDHSPTVLK